MLRTMRWPHFLLTVFVALAYGCKKQETFALPQEADSFFTGSQRKVVRPFGDPWVIHYFPHESMEMTISRLEGSAFFKQLNFQRVVRLNDGTYAASIPADRASTSIASIFVSAGKQASDLKSIADPAGTSVTLLPKE